MATRDWDILMVQRATDLLQQVERIHRNFLQIAAGVQYRSSHGRSPAWEPPVNVVETDESWGGLAALPGGAAARMNVGLEGRELLITGERPLPKCCNDGELKIWEIPLGRFERRLTLIEGSNSFSLGDVLLQGGFLFIWLGKVS